MSKISELIAGARLQDKARTVAAASVAAATVVGFVAYGQTASAATVAEYSGSAKTTCKNTTILSGLLGPAIFGESVDAGVDFDFSAGQSSISNNKADAEAYFLNTNDGNIVDTLLAGIPTGILDNSLLTAKASSPAGPEKHENLIPEIDAGFLRVSAAKYEAEARNAADDDKTICEAAEEELPIAKSRFSTAATEFGDLSGLRDIPGLGPIIEATPLLGDLLDQQFLTFGAGFEDNAISETKLIKQGNDIAVSSHAEFGVADLTLFGQKIGIASGSVTATANGKPGGATVERTGFSVTVNGAPVTPGASISLGSQIIPGAEALGFDVRVSVGELDDEIAEDGTHASGSQGVLQIHVELPVVGELLNVDVWTADAEANMAAGGIQCPDPEEDPSDESPVTTTAGSGNQTPTLTDTGISQSMVAILAATLVALGAGTLGYRRLATSRK